MRGNSEKGSAIFVLFVAVALFGALAFAFMQGSRSSLDLVQNEASKAASTQSQECANALSMAMRRLNTKGCGNKISFAADGSNANVGAPADGSCSIYHPNGGGIKACPVSFVCPTNALTSLGIGDSCGDLYYIGNVNGRIYTKSTHSSTISFGSGAFGSPNLPGASSTTDGTANTNYLVALVNGNSPYAAANYCRAMGPEWYLPARNEGQLFHTNRAKLPFITEPQYWVSTSSGTSALRLVMSTGIVSTANQYNPLAVAQCVRK